MAIDLDDTSETPVAVFRRALAGLLASEVWRQSDEELVEALTELPTWAEQLHGRHLQTVNEVTGRGAIEREQGWSVTDRLAAELHQPVGKARVATALARDLAGGDGLLNAVCEGRVSMAQARVVRDVLKDLPDEATAEQAADVQAALVEHCAQYEPRVIRDIGNALLERLFPEQVDAKLAADLEREEKRARRRRFLSFRATCGGTTDFFGRLPLVEADRFRQLLDAYLERDRKAGDRYAADAIVDPEAEAPTKSQRRADALCHMMDDLDAHGCAPESGGDRPTTVILIDYQALLSGLRGAELLGTGETVAPGTARRMACSGNILPVVVGGDSVPLDVGRTARLFTGGLRRAIIARDRGCAFPGCDVPPARCECHHLVPWWAGGVTRLDGAASVSDGLCAHHHHLVEPDPTADQSTRWTIRLDAQGLPEVVPPFRVDLLRRPRQHARFLLRKHDPDLLPGLDGHEATGPHTGGPRSDGDRPSDDHARPDTDREYLDHPDRDHLNRQQERVPVGAGNDPPSG